MPHKRVAAVICPPCREGADWISNTSSHPVHVAYALDLHAACNGCDCQHKVELQAADKSVQSVRPVGGAA